MYPRSLYAQRHCVFNDMNIHISSFTLSNIFKSKDFPLLGSVRQFVMFSYFYFLKPVRIVLSALNFACNSWFRKRIYSIIVTRTLKHFVFFNLLDNYFSCDSNILFMIVCPTASEFPVHPCFLIKNLNFFLKFTCPIYIMASRLKWCGDLTQQ